MLSDPTGPPTYIHLAFRANNYILISFLNLLDSQIALISPFILIKFRSRMGNFLEIKRCDLHFTRLYMKNTCVFEPMGEHS